MTRLLALYPRAWRDRYEAEFLILLAERPPSLGDRLDTARGALDAHLHPQEPGPGRERDRSGFGPLLGFVLLVGAVVIMANGPVRHDEYGAYRDGMLGMPLFFVSLLLLSFGLYRVVDRLPAAAMASRAAGWTAIIVGPIWSVMPWVAPIGVALLLGVLGLSVGARRAGIWPAWSEIVLVVALAVPTGMLLALPFVPWYTMRVLELNPLVFVGPIGAIWLVVGGLLLRGAPRPTLA